MHTPTVTLRENEGLARRAEPVHVGIPLPRGRYKSAEALKLVDEHGQAPSQQCQATAFWPDQSIRWILIIAQISLNAHESKSLYLRAIEPTAEQSAPATLLPVETEDYWQIELEGRTFRIDKQTGQVDVRTGSAERPVAQLKQRLVTTFESACIPVVDRIQSDPAACGAAMAQVNIQGHWQLAEPPQPDRSLLPWRQADNRPLANFTLTLRFYREGGLVATNYCIHNPRRALHPGGLWDLGDPGSIHFAELSTEVVLSHPADRIELQPEPHHSVLELRGSSRQLSIYQDSSGGENWNSLNHVDKNYQVTTRFRGYRLAGDTEELDTAPPDSMLRAQPASRVSTPAASCSLAMRQFWQNFPSSLRAEGSTLRLGLFPAESGQHYELQGGERKTQTFWLTFDQPIESLAWTAKPIVPVVDTRTYAEAQAFDSFNPDAEPGLLDELIKEGLEGPNNFFAKREIIDEYGWRHFGDIFADHETLYQPEGEAPLVSHYNNQYDAIMGFARQFALTGDTRWFELMDDLARHVTDIDIYHTDEDRAEYNHGLFWHTDHYLPAHTATHRTFSKYNDTSSTPGQTGGGPAAEHCYTTGLKYHGFMTGSRASTEAVSTLAEWMQVLHEGQTGLLARLWSIRKQELDRLKAAVSGQCALPYRHPFTRGTGNYLVALLDAYEQTLDPALMKLADSTVRATLHPRDDIEKRQLLAVETGWSYLVLLSALLKYTATKKRLQAEDDHYYYALSAIEHYTHWMAHNERSFLEDPDQLEYPNDTWVAQDLRKPMILFQAASLGLKEAPTLQEKAGQWLAAWTDRLATSDTLHFARIQIILLQNHGPQTAAPIEVPVTELEDTVAQTEFGDVPKVRLTPLIVSVLRKMLSGLREFRPSQEKQWLASRINKP